MVLLITGAITPAANIAKTKIVDENLRKEQYLSALKKTIDLLSVPMSVGANQGERNISIVYCDNSNPDSIIFSDIKKYAEDKNIFLETLLFQGDSEKISAKGKGYGEGEITRYAIENSVRIKEDTFFIKLTGRLTIDNLDLIVSKLSNKKMYFNVPNHTRRDICDTRFYAVPVEDYKKYFLNAYENVDDEKGYFLEHAFVDTIRKNKLKTYNMPEYPLYSGISGTAGSKYVYSKWKSKIKNVMSAFQYYKV